MTVEAVSALLRNQILLPASDSMGGGDYRFSEQHKRMAKNLKRQPAAVRPNGTTKSANKSRVNGHGLAHDDGLPAADEFDSGTDAPAAVQEEEAEWADDEE